MSKKIETIEVNPTDDYGRCFIDSVNKKFTGDRVKPKGYVEIYEADEDGNKQLVGRHNLVLYLGREWLAQRIVNTNNSAAIPTKDEYINWLGLGDGGVIPGDPFNPVPPVITDTELSSKVMINATDSSAADYHLSTEIGYPETGYYKIPFDTIDFEQDIQNDDSWLVVKITVTVGVDDANGKQLSEAGLFTSESNIGGYGGPFNIFSRVTFPSIVKTSDRRIIFNWFLYV
jgi:hypothetical protein